MYKELQQRSEATEDFWPFLVACKDEASWNKNFVADE
jgi:hypothetical protein